MPSMAPLARFPAFTRPFLVSSSMLGLVHRGVRWNRSKPLPQHRQLAVPVPPVMVPVRGDAPVIDDSTTPLFTFVLWSLSGVDASPEWSHLFSGGQSMRSRCGVVLINSQPAAESTTAFHIPVASRSHIAI